MAAMTNILIKDDATTPVEYTFEPVTDTPFPSWRTAIANVPLDGQMRLSCQMTKLKNGDFKLTYKLEVPVMETLGASGTSGGYVAPPKVAYVNTAIFTLFVNKRSTTTDRVNLLKMGIAFAQGASSTTASGILHNNYAGDGWKGSNTPGPVFFHKLVVPN